MRARYTSFLAFAGILGVHLVLQALLYASGFQTLTADEYGRSFLAARWSLHPYLAMKGTWLPFQMYLLGPALWVFWDLVWTPRLVMIVLGLVSILLMYGFTLEIFNNRRIALFGAALLAINPAHIWLSSAPLTEMPYFTLLLAGLYFFLRWNRNGLKTRDLVLGALFTGLANGFRYEGWIFSAVVSLYLLVTAWRAARLNPALTRSLISRLALAGMILWAVPVTWIAANTVYLGSPFAIFQDVSAYKRAWYQAAPAYTHYLNLFITLDPFAFVLGGLGLVTYLYHAAKKNLPAWSPLLVSLPFVVFSVLHGPQPETDRNLIRYLAPFFFLIYPFAAWLVAYILEHRLSSTAPVSGTLIVIAFVMLIPQARTTLAQTSDIAARGQAVGEALRSTRQANPQTNPTAVVELVYWEYLAVHVGANDISSIYYDRPLDFEHRSTQSLITRDPQILLECIEQLNIGFFVIRSAELRQAIETVLRLLPVQEVNGYAIYQVPDGLTSAAPRIDKTCPFPFGSGY